MSLYTTMATHDCFHGCSSQTPRSWPAPVHHAKPAEAKIFYYWCGIHHRYHCVVHQCQNHHPVCGECAWLAYPPTKHGDVLFLPLFDNDTNLHTWPASSHTSIFHKDRQIPTSPAQRLAKPAMAISSLPKHGPERILTNDSTGQNLWSTPVAVEPNRDPSTAVHEMPDYVLLNGDGDVVMENSAPLVHLPISSVSKALQFASPRHRQTGYSAVRFLSSSLWPRLLYFEYIDINELPAVQPVSKHAQELHVYFGEYNRQDGHGSKPLRGIRTWCCWAQSNPSLDPKVRWLLTYIFDSVNVMLSREGRGTPADRRAESWTNRHVLFQQLVMVEDLFKHFGTKNMMMPRPKWSDV